MEDFDFIWFALLCLPTSSILDDYWVHTGNTKCFVQDTNKKNQLHEQGTMSDDQLVKMQYYVEYNNASADIIVCCLQHPKNQSTLSLCY